MLNVSGPVILPKATAPHAVPCFIVSDLEADVAPGPAGPRQIWDWRCSRIFERFAENLSNTEAVEFLAAVTGKRFKYKTISERRSSLGLASPRQNNWSAPLRKWRPWSTK